MKKKGFIRKTLIILLLALLLPLTALVATAIAATTTSTNLTVVKDPDGNNMYTVETENGVINYQTKFVHSSTATLSYHTKYLYFTKDKLNGNPPAPGTSYEIERNSLTVTTEIIGSTQYETFRIPEETVLAAIGILYGSDYVTDQSKLANVTLYLSHGFIIKRRDTAQDAWMFYENTVYNTLSGVRDNAKDPYNNTKVDWSSGTYRNFQFYFDCPLKLNVAQYNITVQADKGGSIGQSQYTAYLNEKITVKAFPDRGYTFAGWEIVSGNIGSFNTTSETSSFVMPAGDVTLRAKFNETITAPTPTPKPDDLDIIGTPVPTVPPTATPAPTPTPKPYFPSENKETYQENYRYYTTDAGYTMELVHNKDGKLAPSTSTATNGGIINNDYTELTTSYPVGTDASGNTWFFIPSGSNATYVHPNVYKGNDANSASVKNITELTFPSSITYNGTTYTVTSIGGGASKYNGNTEIYVPGGPPYITNEIGYNTGHYNWLDNGFSTESGNLYSYDFDIYCTYRHGVIGNGAIISYNYANEEWTNADTGEVRYDIRSYVDEYHVYNTTLRKVTIPSTVTTICGYAFANCQALTVIEGAEGVTTIETYGLSAGDQRHYKISEKGTETNYRHYYYNEDISFTTATARMTQWQDMVEMPEHCYLGKLSKLKTIAAYAFTLRNNLGSVILPSTVTSIGMNAFAGCELDSIEIPGKSVTIFPGERFTGIDDVGHAFGTSGEAATLGTKGTADTTIVTIPDSTALNYGLLHDTCYKVQAGYKVTYIKNMTPTEDNRSFTTEMEQLFGTVKKKMELEFGSSFYIYLAESGEVFSKSKDSASATKLPSSATFTDIIKLPINFVSGNTTVGGDICFAVGANGEVWAMYGAIHNGTYYGFSWTNLNMPSVATNIQFSSTGNCALVYYLNANQKICVKKVIVDTSVSNRPLKVAYSQILDADSTFKYLEFEIAHKNKENKDTAPSSISTSEGINCTFDDGSIKLCMYGPGQTYSSGIPPVLYATAAGGMMYEFPTLPFLDGTSPVCYRPPVSTGSRGSGLEIVSGLRSGSWKHYLYYTLSGSFYQYDKASTSSNKHTLVGSGSFEVIPPTNSEREGSQYVVLKNNTDGQAYVLLPNFTIYSGSPKLVSLSFDNPETAEFWEYSYWSSSDGATVRYLYGFSGTTLYRVSSNGYVSTTADVKKVVRASNSSTGITKALMLKTNGTLYGMGTSSYGEIGLSSGEYTSFSSCGVSGTTPVFTDICFGTSNSGFALTNTGVIYGAGFNNSAWGNTDDHYRFEKITNQSFNPFVDATNEPEILRTGYRFSHTFYGGDVFQYLTTPFLNWSTKADGTGTKYSPGTTVNLTAALSVYGQWSSAEGKNTIIYIPNGGVGVMEDDVYPANTRAVTLKANTYERKGYEFVGWSYAKEPKSSDKIYPDKSQITIAYGTNELYAQWKPFTYTVKVGSDDMRITTQSFSTHTLQLDQTLTLGIKDAKSLTVNFNPNKQSSMSTTPSPNTSSQKTASLEFFGWRLYEDTNGDGKISTDDDKYLSTYSPNTTVKNLTTKKGVVLYAFPYWSGSSSSVTLPEYTCTGYDLVGFTPGKAYAPNFFASDVVFSQAVADNTLIVAPVGSNATYQPKIDGETLYAYYEARTYKIELVAKHSHAEEGEIIENQTSVYMTYDQAIPSVMVPQSERFVFMGYYDALDSEGVPVEGVSEQFYDARGNAFYDETTGSPKMWRIDDGSVRILYAFFTSETKVMLDGRGATKQEQTEVTMVYEALGPAVILPEKTGYTFQGYYTGTRGSGKQYFDASGKCIAVWTEKKTNRLYAYWLQNPFEYPELEDTENPDVLPEESMEIVIAQDKSTVHIYSDDNNSDTNAETDVPPYQVEDIVVNGVLENAGGIPSTEKVAIRAKMGSWRLSCKLERRSGVDYVRVHVTVPYRTQYEDAEDEHLIVSEIRYYTTEVMVPKAWSYWELTEGGLYIPERVVVNNGALENGQVEVPIQWECTDAVKKVQYYITTYGEKENHVRWDSYDTDDDPSLEVILPTEEYIVSEIPGEEPDVIEYLKIVSYNAAWNDTTRFIVKNDHIYVEGVTLLSDAENENGTGENPDIGSLAEMKRKITETVYNQTYMSGVALFKSAENGRYETDAEIIYKAVPENVGERKELHIKGTDVNEINIHTPVVCIPVIQAEHDEMYQCEKVPENHTVLVSDCEGIHSDFILKIGNIGWHSEKKGYGERDYGKYLAEKDGRKRNEVKFPFPVWIDIGNEKDNSNDRCIEAGEWYVLGEDMQRFYVPVWIEEGSYEILVRTVAVNGSGKEEKAEKRRNTQLFNYVAEECIKVYVTGRLYGFTVYEVNGNTAWEDVPKEEINYTVGVQAPDYDEWDTLPLRVGTHPYYRNIGGLPAGGGVKFYVKCNGGFLGKETTLTIIPHMFSLEEDEYRKVDVYYEEASEKGVFLRTWDAKERSIVLTSETDRKEGQEYMERLMSTAEGKHIVDRYREQIEIAVSEWYGEFSLPERIYVAKEGTDVMGVQRREGLSFTEEFWLDDVPVVLKFELLLENSEGDILYYGMLPEQIKNNIWQTEAKDSYREDKKGNRYEIQGGEVAVIYPGDSPEVGKTAYGIY